MPTVKTIKPAGGGDYTTLQAWEDFADGEASADQHAECYSGGDMGEVLLSGWTATPTASLFPRIYSATGEKHDGTNTTANGAHISVAGGNSGIETQVQYTEIDGIAFDLTSSITSTEAVFIDSGTNGLGRFSTIKNCLVTVSGSTTSTVRCIYWFDDSDDATPGATVLTAYNNLIYGHGGTGGNNVGIFCNLDDGNNSSSSTWEIEVYNNEVRNMHTGFFFRCDKNGFFTPTMNVTSKNNVAFCHTSDWVRSAVNGANLNLTNTNCGSGDDTADDFSGSGNLVNLVEADEVDTAGTNMTPKNTGSLYNGGVTVGSFSVDALGTTRPQSSSWDIGPIELIVIPTGVKRSFGTIIG